MDILCAKALAGASSAYGSGLSQCQCSIWLSILSITWLYRRNEKYNQKGQNQRNEVDSCNLALAGKFDFVITDDNDEDGDNDDNDKVDDSCGRDGNMICKNHDGSDAHEANTDNSDVAWC